MFFNEILYQMTKNQTYITETKLSSFDIEDEDIYKILDINKAHEMMRYP